MGQNSETTRKFRMVEIFWMRALGIGFAILILATMAFEYSQSGRFSPSTAFFLIALLFIIASFWKLSLTATPLSLNWGNITIEWNEMNRASIYPDSLKTSTIHIFTSSHPPRHVELQLFNDDLPALTELIRTHAPGGNCLRVELERDLGDKA